MKKRTLPFLPCLAAAACAGAGVFFVSLTAVDDSRERGAGGRRAQRSAFSAGSGSVTVEAARTHDAAAEALRGQEGTASGERLSTPAAMALAMGFESAARVRAARRDFWIHLATQRPNDTGKMAKLAREYRIRRAWWAQAALNEQPGMNERYQFGRLAKARRDFEAAMASGVRKLSEEYSAEWRKCEADNWSQYVFRLDDPYFESFGAPPSGGGLRGSGRHATARPLFDEWEFLQDVADEVPAGIGEIVAGGFPSVVDSPPVAPQSALEAGPETETMATACSERRQILRARLSQELGCTPEMLDAHDSRGENMSTVVVRIKTPPSAEHTDTGEDDSGDDSIAGDDATSDPPGTTPEMQEVLNQDMSEFSMEKPSQSADTVDDSAEFLPGAPPK